MYLLLGNYVMKNSQSSTSSLLCSVSTLPSSSPLYPDILRPTTLPMAAGGVPSSRLFWNTSAWLTCCGLWQRQRCCCGHISRPRIWWYQRGCSSSPHWCAGVSARIELGGGMAVIEVHANTGGSGCPLSV